MDFVKKTGIVAGAIVGGAVGGVISMVGKISKTKDIDDIGSSITSSMILAGEMAGEIVSGTADAVSGALTDDGTRAKEGLDDLKSVGKKVVDNLCTNVGYLAAGGSEIKDGIKTKDNKRVKNAVKNLGKIVVVGALTVGAIKMADSSENDEGKDK